MRNTWFEALHIDLLHPKATGRGWGFHGVNKIKYPWCKQIKIQNRSPTNLKHQDQKSCSLFSWSWNDRIWSWIITANWFGAREKYCFAWKFTIVYDQTNMLLKFGSRTARKTGRSWCGTQLKIMPWGRFSIAEIKTNQSSFDWFFLRSGVKKGRCHRCCKELLVYTGVRN